MVRGNAINRESGENPEQTRYCNSYHNSRHNATVAVNDGKAPGSQDKSGDLPGQHIVL